MLGKKGNKSSKPPKEPKQPKAPKPPKARVPADIYTLFLGLTALFLLTATVVLGLNYYWYLSTDPAVVPMSSWER